MGKQLQKIYLTNYNLLIAQDLQHAPHQILLLIFLKEIIELNLNLDMMIQKVQLAKIITDAEDVTDAD